MLQKYYKPKMKIIWRMVTEIWAITKDAMQNFDIKLINERIEWWKQGRSTIISTMCIHRVPGVLQYMNHKQIRVHLPNTSSLRSKFRKFRIQCEVISNWICQDDDCVLHKNSLMENETWMTNTSYFFSKKVNH